MLTMGSSTFAGGGYYGSTAMNVGRFYAVDVDAALSGSPSFIVVDSILDNNSKNNSHNVWGFALVRSVGPFWVVGTLGGVENATSPTEYLFAPGTTDAPSLDAPLWKFTGAGNIDNLDAVLVASSAASTTVQVLGGGAGNPGAGGNGGQVYWHELEIMIP